MLLLAQGLATDGTKLHGAGKDHSPDWWKVQPQPATPTPSLSVLLQQFHPGWGNNSRNDHAIEPSCPRKGEKHLAQSSCPDPLYVGALQALTGMLLERGLVAMVSKAGARGSYSSITLTPQVRPTKLPACRATARRSRNEVLA